jgi:hypothetical protein
VAIADGEMASRDSMPLRREGRADPRSFVPLLLRALD